MSSDNLKNIFEAFVIMFFSTESQNDMKIANLSPGHTGLMAICCTNLHWYIIEFLPLISS